MKKLLLLLIAVPFILGAAPSRVNNFSSQTTIRAAEVNTDLDNLYGHLAKGVTNSTGYWACTDSACAGTCQLVIDGGIITACN